MKCGTWEWEGRKLCRLRNAFPSRRRSSRGRMDGGSKWESRVRCLVSVGDFVLQLPGVAHCIQHGSPYWRNPEPTSGSRTAGQATSGSAMAGFPGLERKFRRGRPRGKSVCLCRRKENRPRRLETATEWRYPGPGPAGGGRYCGQVGPPGKWGGQPQL